MACRFCTGAFGLRELILLIHETAYNYRPFNDICHFHLLCKYAWSQTGVLVIYAAKKKQSSAMAEVFLQPIPPRLQPLHLHRPPDRLPVPQVIPPLSVLVALDDAGLAGVARSGETGVCCWARACTATYWMASGRMRNGWLSIRREAQRPRQSAHNRE